MTFGNIIDINPKTMDGSEAGLVMQKLNQIFQSENGDLKIVLNLSDPTTYVRYNKSNSHIEFYIAGTLEGYIDATGWHNG